MEPASSITVDKCHETAHVAFVFDEIVVVWEGVLLATRRFGNPKYSRGEDIIFFAEYAFAKRPADGPARPAVSTPLG